MSIVSTLQPLAAALDMETATFALLVGAFLGFIAGKGMRSNSGKVATADTAMSASNLRNSFGTQPKRTLTGGSVSLATPSASVEMDLELCVELKRLLKSGNKIQAIKELRAKTNTSLSDAKTLIELFEVQMDRIPDGRS